MNDSSQPAQPFSSPEAVQAGYRIPLHRPRWTYVLLAVNVIVFGAMTLFGALNGLGLGGTQNVALLRFLGAQDNQLVGQGDYYRLVTSMFIHIGLIHLLFNSYALYIIGQDVERLYGGGRFLIIYFVSGLGGSLASFALGGMGVSAGASGAIFGLIGTEIAFFYLHRETFGQHGRQQLRNLLAVAGINLFLGLTIPGINNLAHIGGLVFGAALGWLLAPKYRAPSLFAPAADGSLTLEDSVTVGARLPGLLVVTIILGALALVGTLRWAA